MSFPSFKRYQSTHSSLFFRLIFGWTYRLRFRLAVYFSADFRRTEIRRLIWISGYGWGVYCQSSSYSHFDDVFVFIVEAQKVIELGLRSVHFSPDAVKQVVTLGLQGINQLFWMP